MTDKDVQRAGRMSRTTCVVSENWTQTVSANCITDTASSSNCNAQRIQSVHHAQKSGKRILVSLLFPTTLYTCLVEFPCLKNTLFLRLVLVTWIGERILRLILMNSICISRFPKCTSDFQVKSNDSWLFNQTTIEKSLTSAVALNSHIYYAELADYKCHNTSVVRVSQWKFECQ